MYEKMRTLSRTRAPSIPPTALHLLPSLLSISPLFLASMRGRFLAAESRSLSLVSLCLSRPLSLPSALAACVTLLFRMPISPLSLSFVCYCLCLPLFRSVLRLSPSAAHSCLSLSSCLSLLLLFRLLLLDASVAPLDVASSPQSISLSIRSGSTGRTLCMRMWSEQGRVCVLNLRRLEWTSARWRAPAAARDLAQPRHACGLPLMGPC